MVSIAEDHALAGSRSLEARSPVCAAPEGGWLVSRGQRAAMCFHSDLCAQLSFDACTLIQLYEQLRSSSLNSP